MLPRPGGARSKGSACCQAHGMSERVAALLLLAALCAPVPATAQNASAPGAAAVDLATAHCGKKFRVATHQAPPFTLINTAKCNPDKRCPPEAWFPGKGQSGGGLTYKFVMESVKPNLEAMCVAAGKEGNEAKVEFDWYLPTGLDVTSASGPVRMVCNGDFQKTGKPAGANCSASAEYKGASDWNKCTSREDPGCVSKGPDMVAGAVHVLRERLDLLDFTSPYIEVRQVVVTKSKFAWPNIMKTFQCFDETLWFLGLFMEVAIVWGMILLVETWVNPQVDKSNFVTALYDSLYWAFGSALDPGGPGKAPFTIGGRLFMFGHWFYLGIIAATYTGVLGPFLATSGAVVVTGLESLQGGGFTVAVKGPKWAMTDPKFKGKWVDGGDGDEKTTRSTQFKVLQNIMQQDSTAKFSIQTSKNTATFYKKDGLLTELKYSNELEGDPCSKTLGAIKGVFDLLECGGKNAPDALIHDAPSVYYELRKRKEVKGKCTLHTVGRQFFVSGFGMGFPKNVKYSRAFSAAIRKVITITRTPQLVSQERGLKSEPNSLSWYRQSPMAPLRSLRRSTMCRATSFPARCR